MTLTGAAIIAYVFAFLLGVVGNVVISELRKSGEPFENRLLVSIFVLLIGCAIFKAILNG